MSNIIQTDWLYIHTYIHISIYSYSYNNNNNLKGGHEFENWGGAIWGDPEVGKGRKKCCNCIISKIKVIIVILLCANCFVVGCH